jgi:hypothetical protein
MIFFLSIVITILLTILTVVHPVALLSGYFLIASFFQVKVPGLEFGTLVPFSAFITIALLIRYKEVYWNPQLRKYLTILFLSWCIPSLYHWIAWGSIPPYTTDFIKSTWGLIFLIVPIKDLSIKKLILFSNFSFIISMLLIGYKAIPYYLQTGRSLGRQVEFISSAAQMSDIGYQNEQVLNITSFSMGIPQSIYLSVLFAVPITGLILAVLHRDRVKCIIFGILFVLGGGVFYCSQYLNTFLTILICLTTVFIALQRLYLSQKLKRRAITYFGVLILGAVSILFVFLGTIKNPYSDKFEVIDGGDNRISRFALALSQFSTVKGLVGVGMEKPYEGIYYAVDGYLSGHSTIIDQLLGFGIVMGILSILVYIYPLWIMIRKRETREILPTMAYLILLSIFSAASFQALVNIFGQDKNQLGFYIALTVILLRLVYDQEEITTKLNFTNSHEKIIKDEL